MESSCEFFKTVHDKGFEKHKSWYKVDMDGAFITKNPPLLTQEVKKPRRKMKVIQCIEPVKKKSRPHLKPSVFIAHQFMKDVGKKIKAEQESGGTLLLDKGVRCEIPVLDPFAPEVFIKPAEVPTIACPGRDWVKCYHAKCKIVDDLAVKDIMCRIRDILYRSDNVYTIGPTTHITQNKTYELKDSDHIKVSCTGVSTKTNVPVEWRGVTVGLRPVPPTEPPLGRENSYNVVILGFGSMSRNGFIRRMPKSWKVLTEELEAVVLESYNIVGEGASAALFPILTGKMDFELPEARKGKLPYGTLDSFPFIFTKLKENGYRTAYFEDQPKHGTFQYRFNGWEDQPTDHYMRPLLLEMDRRPQAEKHCVGDTPLYTLMINLTQQFMELSGKKFIFTMIKGISRDNFTHIQLADDDTAAFLRDARRLAEDTLLVVMGDHGTRYAEARNTMQGRLEERLPLMAIVPPLRLRRERPTAYLALLTNANTLSTPHDIHATILDVLGLTYYQNPYVVPGADYMRALSVLNPVTRDRSCSEAGIDPFWCSCMSWEDVTPFEEFYTRTGEALLAYIYQLTTEAGEKCVPRSLSAISWVKKQVPSYGWYVIMPLTEKLSQAYKKAIDSSPQNYQIKIVVDPGKALFEAIVTYNKERDQFAVDSRDISRINDHGAESQCVSETHPHLSKFCYCSRPEPTDPGCPVPPCLQPDLPQ